MSINEVRGIMKQYGMRPSKRFGQHFLIDDTVRDAVIAELPAGRSDYIEMGPGPGILTEKVIERGVAPFAVCEIERRMLAILRDRFGMDLQVFEQDGARLDITGVVMGTDGVVFGNLPYNAGTAILRNVIAHSAVLSAGVFMLQKEVAEKVVANPGERLFSPVGTLVHLTGDATLLFDVPPRAFLPPPAVESSVVRIDFRTHDRIPGYFSDAFSVLVKLFSHRRKTLNNIFKMHSFDRALFDRYDIRPVQRIEELTFSQLTGLLSSIMENTA